MHEQMEEFEEHLRHLALVRQNQVPFMVNWARDHIAVGKPEESLFSDMLEREGRQYLEYRDE